MKKNSQTLLEELNQQMKDEFEQHMCDFLNFKKKDKSSKTTIICKIQNLVLTLNK